MQVRVDDDMRAIVTLTRDEYALLGGDKESVASAVEREFDGIFAVFGGSEPVAEPVVVAPGGEFAIPVAEDPATRPEIITE